jgi:hypothetical protein
MFWQSDILSLPIIVDIGVDNNSMEILYLNLLQRMIEDYDQSSEYEEKDNR